MQAIHTDLTGMSKMKTLRRKECNWAILLMEQNEAGLRNITYKFCQLIIP